MGEVPRLCQAAITQTSNCLAGESNVDDIPAIASNDSSGAGRRETRQCSRSYERRALMATNPIDKTPYLLERAASCDRLAASASSPETRQTMLYLAMRWRALAGVVEAKREPPKPQTQPHPSAD
jgi:hypothetical protein